MFCALCSKRQRPADTGPSLGIVSDDVSGLGGSREGYAHTSHCTGPSQGS